MSQTTQRRAEVTIDLDTGGSESKLDKLKAKAAELRKAFADATKAGDTKEINRLTREINKTSSEIRRLQTNAERVRDAMVSLDKATMPVTIPAEGGSVLSIDYPYPNLRERWIYDINADTVYCEHQGDSLALIPHGGSTGIGSATVADGMVIDTKVKVCVKFHAADVPDTTRLFNIRNRLYACERIEVTVDAKGKQPMMTGYFFPASL